MAEQLYKLSPHRDLQCYFLMPSAIAAMSGATDTGFTVSGKWRQQFDWAVVEWNRDNVFEHPSLRYLPEGDLSGLVLTYDETRTNCIPMESNLDPVVDWNDLRIWAMDDSGQENLYHVNYWPNYATPVTGSYVGASGTMTLTSSPGVGNRVGLAFLEEHHYYTVGPQDSLADIAAGVAQDVNNFSTDFVATSSGADVTVTWKQGPNWKQLLGANGNRITMYGFAENGQSCWAQPAVMFSGGQFPSTYRVTIDFGALKASGIPTNRVRKLRWTWAADMQPGSFQQKEFAVTISNWTVTGNNRQYFVAGPGSRRIEDTDTQVSYSGTWDVQAGNYSASRIHHTATPASSCTFTYTETAAHSLYVGSRLLSNGALTTISIDGQPVPSFNTALNGEDVLVRQLLGALQAGTHTVTVTHAGPAGADLFIDFFEIAYPSEDLPSFAVNTQLSLATDWDTYHSQSLPAERTAWLINTLGFHGRVNHYTGALWFYEIYRPGTQYASLALNFTAQDLSSSPTVVLAIASSPTDTTTLIKHLVLPDDTTETVVQALAALINVGTNLIWASANGAQLVLTARAMGTDGNGIYVQPDASSQGFTITSNGTTLAGGVDGTPYDLDPSNNLNATLMAAADFWRTDLSATPRINRAARDWHSAFFTALKGYGLDCVAAFSTELMNGDPSLAAGIAQRYPDGTAAVLNTPSIQTNFSPTSLAFWKQVYLDMAGLQAGAGLTPYLQSGEVQWWYFPNTSGMPFYDAYTTTQFQAQYGTAMQVITTNQAEPSQYPNECAFLPGLIGAYTGAIRSALQAQFPGCRYEVLYPTDTNNTPLNQVINFAAQDWTPANLTCLKTESFGFTGSYNLDLSTYSMNVSGQKGFSNSARSHLIGISDAFSAWMKECDIAQSNGLESVVLFALDQYCLVGYAPPPFVELKRNQRAG